jgi:HNH endonuclease
VSTGGVPLPRDIEEFARVRFWPFVKKGPGCWLWTGWRDPHGYGRFTFRGRLMLAHRFAFELRHGRAPDVCRHRCDNTGCVRASHLLDGTQFDNVADRERRNRTARGSRVRSGHLTESDVRRMRALRTQGWTLRQLASTFKTDSSNTHRITSGETWRHVR